jgi:predicted AlkP superfamily phosphohydrolase/phosphomutase
LPGRRVVVFGLDGASWDFINRMIELGAMPYVKNMLNGGARGVLLSSYPPITPSAWPSITTGVNPGKHGIFDFARTDVNTGEQTLTTTFDLEHPRIYEMLATRGIETLVFNPIPPYPLIPIENLKVASIVFSPKPVYYPEHIQKYAEGFPDYTELIETCKGKRSPDNEAFLELKLQNTSQRLTIVEEALRSENWSLAWIRLQDPDDLFHTAADEAFSGHPKVTRVFSMIDRLIKASKTLADLVVLVSDHGFKKYKQNICVNTILFKGGLARPASTGGLADDAWRWDKNLFGGRADSLRIPSWLTEWLINHSAPLLTRLAGTILKLTKKTYESPAVDPVASRAYSPTPYGHGVLVRNTNDLEATRRIVMQQRGIANVKYPEEVYWGAYVSRAPNLIVMVDREAGYRLGSNRIERKAADDKAVWDHDPYGVVAFAGEGVRPCDIGLVNAWDVAPTIMAYMGAALPDDSDGKALNAIPSTGASERASYDYTSGWHNAKLRSWHPR